MSAASERATIGDFAFSLGMVLAARFSHHPEIAAMGFLYNGIWATSSVVGGSWSALGFFSKMSGVEHDAGQL